MPSQNEPLTPASDRCALYARTELSTALDDLAAKQKAHADAISAIGDLLGPPLESVDLQLTLNGWPEMSEEVRRRQRPETR